MPTDTSTVGAGVGYSLRMNLSLRTHAATLCFAASLLCGVVEARPSPKNPPFTDAEAAQQVLVAELQLARGDTAAGVRAYLAVLARYPERDLAMRVTQLAAAADLPSVMLEAAYVWAALAPADDTAQRALWDAQLRTGGWATVAKALEARVKAAEPARRGEALDAAMLQLAEFDDATAAAQVARRLARGYPKSPEALSGLAQVAANGSLITEAMQTLAALAQLRTLTAEEEFLRLRLLASTGDHESVLQALGEPTADEVPGKRLLRVQVLIGAGDEAGARKALVALLEAPRLRALGLRLLASVEMRAKRYDEAQRLYAELDTVNSKDAEGIMGMAAVARARGDLDKALELFSRIERGPQALQAQAQVWRLQRERGEPHRAAADFDRFLAENPDQRATGMALRSGLLLRGGDGAAALAQADAGLVAFPESDNLLQARAAALDAVGRRKESLAWYAARTRARPWDPEAMNNQAYQLALAGEQLPLAKKLAEQAVAARPVAAYFDTLGWVHYRRGQLPAAREWLEKALARDSEPEIAAHLGEVLWAAGEKARAEMVWRAGLAEAAPEDLPTLKATVLRVSGLKL